MFRFHYNIYNNTIFSIGNKLLDLISQLMPFTTLIYQKEGTYKWQKQITTPETLSTLVHLCGHGIYTTYTTYALQIFHLHEFVD
jgi:hypothetical protein